MAKPYQYLDTHACTAFSSGMPMKMSGQGLRRHLAVVVLICLVLIVFPLQSWGQETDRIGTVLAVDGVAEVRAQGATEWERLRFRDAIFPQDTVRTGADSKAKVLLRDDTIMTLSERSEMEFTEFLLTQDKRRNIVSLLLGTLKVVTTRILGSDSVTQIQTPNTVAGVRGTTFVVRFTPPDTTDIFVLQGIVTARNLDPATPNEEPVPGNTRTSIVGTAAPAQPTAISPNEVQALEQELNVIEQVPTEVTPTENLEPPETPRGEELAPDTQGSVQPEARTVGVETATPVEVVGPEIDTQIALQPAAAASIAENPQTSDTIITPDTSPMAVEALKAMVNVIVNFPGR